VRLARTSAAPTWIVVSPRAPRRRCLALERAGAEVVVVRGRGKRVDLPRLLDELGRRELLSVLVEGGPTLLGGFFDAGLVDKVHAFVAPRIIGGAGALGAVGGQGSAHLGEAVSLEVVRTRWVGTDLAIVGYPVHGRGSK
jgi:diaminohydroxyphosphoribosylaminopyrimidine deaminase/5-amino-6-(5-phosphoribosylamino)uracil reductase